ncbi:hypothetical protein ALC53_12383 [Atta colombica]|uniref:Uncharacterized protein n=1 Tax=Atta colombica TaxID=520822 RepID=A0A195AYQ0_9HYME|nr:hypothetical protein ALC53_12383 [Atta colombica]
MTATMLLAAYIRGRHIDGLSSESPHVSDDDDNDDDDDDDDDDDGEFVYSLLFLFRQDHSETEETMSKANGCERGFTIDDGIELLPAIVPRELIPSAEEEPATWSPARVRPSVVLQMKTLNNLVAGCKSRREATIDLSGTTLINYGNSIKIDRQPGGVGVETRGAAADNILAGSSFMTRGYEPGRAITPRIFPALVVPLWHSLHLRESSATGCQFLRAYRTINWKRDVLRRRITRALKQRRATDGGC